MKGASSDTPSGAALRRAIYRGAIVRFDANAASRRLRASIVACMSPELGELGELERMRRCHERLGARLFEVVTELRARLTTDPRVLADVRALLETHGIDPEKTAIDVPRLRVIAPFAHRIPAAAPAYFAHRDTWYANPDAQLNWWMPLHAVSARDTFTLHPDVFATPIANDSETFDYQTWKNEVGFQARHSKVGASYPRALVDVGALRAVPVVARAAEVIVFSGAHLHRTGDNETNRARFSVDFRTVDLADDRAGVGAPDVDDRSRGCTLADYEMTSTSRSAERGARS